MPKKALPAAMLLSLLICAIGAIAFVRAAHEHATPTETSTGAKQTLEHSHAVNVQGKRKDVRQCTVACSAGG